MKLEPQQQSASQRITVFLIWVYKSLTGAIDLFLLSGLGLKSGCYQTPTCSEYTISEIQKRGTMRGLSRGFFRVLGCWRGVRMSPNPPEKKKHPHSTTIDN